MGVLVQFGNYIMYMHESHDLSQNEQQQGGVNDAKWGREKGCTNVKVIQRVIVTRCSFRCTTSKQPICFLSERFPYRIYH